MAIAPVVTGGFGSFGSIPLVVTGGFAIGDLIETWSTVNAGGAAESWAAVSSSGTPESTWTTVTKDATDESSWTTVDTSELPS